MQQMSSRGFALYGWLLLLVTIPLISAWGRPLLNALRELMPMEALALMMLGASLLLLAGCAAWLRRRGTGFRGALLVGAWTVPLFLLLPLTLPVVEERIHFLLFGGFGFFSTLLFPLPAAIAVALLGAGLDELWQWYLPDRVGDWRDVGFNALAGVGGVVTAWLGRRG